MNQTWIAAASDGLYIYAGETGSPQLKSRSLPGEQVTCVTASGSRITAGTTGGIYQSEDLGESWHPANDGLDLPHIRWLAHHPDDPGLILAGTEPAGVFRSSGSGRWQACPEVGELRDAYHWYLPYSPEAGCVRGFAFHESRVFAAVEVGGVLISTDRGQTWALAPGSTGDPRSAPLPNIHPDVHSILVHPTDPDLIFAPTGGGFYRSLDGGRHWELLYRCYCRAVWVDPADPNHILLGPADSVDRNGRIERSLDGGQTWLPASAGLQTPWPRHMVERFYAAGDELLAVLSNGSWYAATVQSLEWRLLPGGTGRINALAVV